MARLICYATGAWHYCLETLFVFIPVFLSKKLSGYQNIQVGYLNDNKTIIPLSNAKVKITFDETLTSVEGLTDSKGYFKLEMPSDLKNRSGTIKVRADHFMDYEQRKSFNNEDQLQVILYSHGDMAGKITSNQMFSDDFSENVIAQPTRIDSCEESAMLLDGKISPFDYINSEYAKVEFMYRDPMISRAPLVFDRAGKMFVNIRVSANSKNSDNMHIAGKFNLRIGREEISKNNMNVHNECAGVSEIKPVNPVVLKDPVKSNFYFIQTNHMGKGKFFSLSPGEFEVFSFEFHCKAPGRYQVDAWIDYDFSNQSKSTKVKLPPLVCPWIYTNWSTLTNKKMETLKWSGNKYEIDKK
jgi:hypothetical protein